MCNYNTNTQGLRIPNVVRIFILHSGHILGSLALESTWCWLLLVRAKCVRCPCGVVDGLRLITFLPEGVVLLSYGRENLCVH
jgi:hypothetical protein